MTIQTDPDRSVDHYNPDIDKSVESLSSIRQQKPSHSDGILHNGSLGRPPELRLEQTGDENFGSATVEVEPMTGVTALQADQNLKNCFVTQVEVGAEVEQLAAFVWHQ